MSATSESRSRAGENSFFKTRNAKIIGLSLAAGSIALVIGVLAVHRWAPAAIAWQIVKALFLGALIWLALTVGLLLDTDPLDSYRMFPARARERLRALRREFPRLGSAFLGYAVLAIVGLCVWAGIGALLYHFGPDNTVTIVWICAPMLLAVLAIFGVYWLVLIEVVMPILAIGFYFISLPVRFGARKLGVRGLGAFLESSAVVMIALAQYLQFMATDKSLSAVESQSMRDFGSQWLNGLAVLCAALGGTYSLLAHLGFYDHFIRPAKAESQAQTGELTAGE